MNTALKITAFAAGLAAAFGATYGVGSSVNPVSTESKSSHGEHAEAADKGEAAEKGGHGGHGGGGAHDALPGGLQISQDGYTLALETASMRAGQKGELRFAITDAGGRKVTAYEREHGKELHLIIASRDLSTYRHLHPTRSADGTWTTPVDLPTAGGYRVFADFKPKPDEAMAGADGAAKGLTLGADLAVSGAYEPAALPEARATAEVDGYTVTLDGELSPGKAGDLTLSVSKDGKPVTDLDPYLGAYGHLVALRSGDLAYLHVHPNGEPGDGKTKAGPEVAFTATAPSAGAYRLFLDFQHDGKVRTAAFTVHAGGHQH